MGLGDGSCGVQCAAEGLYIDCGGVAGAEIGTIVQWHVVRVGAAMVCAEKRIAATKTDDNEDAIILCLGTKIPAIFRYDVYAADAPALLPRKMRCCQMSQE